MNKPFVPQEGRYRIVPNKHSRVYKFAILDTIRGGTAVVAYTKSKQTAVKVAHALQYVQDDTKRLLAEVLPT